MKHFWFSLLVVSSLFLFSCGVDSTAPAKNKLEGDAPSEPKEKQVPARTSPSTIKFHVRDFGADPASEDVREALECAVVAAKQVGGASEILFEPGAVYRISLPENIANQSKSAFHIKGATNLVINGQGATLVVTHPEIGAISTENSSQIAVKNFKIDYDPLPYALGTVVNVNPSEYWFELKVDDDFMEPDQPCFERAMSKWGLTIRDEPDGGRRYGPTAVFAERWEKTGERIWRFFPPQKGGGYTNPLIASGLKSGDRYIHMARNYAQAVTAKNCDHILWENITVLSSPGLAFYPHRTSHHTIRDCHVKVKEDRIFSTNADGIHMRGSRGHVLIEGCSFEGMADDAINVHSSALSVQAQPAPNQVLVKKHSFSVRPGDELMLVRSSSAEILGTAVVKAVEDAGNNLLITLERELPELATGEGFSSSDNLYNLSESTNPFVIRNCRFNDYRGRGVLLSARGGVVENNEFDLRQGWGVVMNYESTRWAEGPIAHDIIIRNNEFHGHGARPAAILSHLVTRKGEVASSRPFRNIQIEGNQFYEYGSPIIELNAVSNVVIRNNQSFCSEAAQRGRSEYAAVSLSNCDTVTIDQLKVQDNDPRQIAAVEIGADCEAVSVANVTASGKVVLDRRAE